MKSLAAAAPLRTAARCAALSLLLAACARPAMAPTPRPRPATPPAPARLAAVTTLVRAAPAVVGLDARLPATLDSVMRAGIAAGAAPGATLAVGRYGRLVYLKGFGTMYAGPGAPRVTPTTIYDLASLTKVVATTTAAMILEDEGKLQIDRPVAFYLPEFDDSSKAGITVRMLLTHRGGLEAFAPLYQTLRGREQYLQAINSRPLAYTPGTQTVYSDWDFVLMQLVIEHITGEPLDRFVQERVFGPLGMHDTLFRPPPSLIPRIAATEVDSTRGGLIRGEVHDPNAWALGGVSGHAGLFSTAPDLAIFAQMLLNGGAYDGVRIVRPETVARWTAPQYPGSSRALGWDTPSGKSSSGQFFSPWSFGHTGFTGTSIWIDPTRGLFVVLLTNRVNYGESNEKHADLRRAVADAVQSAILDAPLVDWERQRQ
ncbi:MAG TPA: serine hydrolase [Longimicrobiaceae bacterium]|nr:serine hydrolase [Longimicrobiaceae bacterium]